MFKKSSRTKNIRRKIEVTEDDTLDVEQGIYCDLCALGQHVTDGSS